MSHAGRSTVFTCLTALALALLSGGGVSSAQPAEVRAAIEDGNKQFIAAFGRGDGKAVAALYSAGAQVFPPNGDIVQGTEAIANFWQRVMESGIKGVELTTLDVDAQGDTAHEVGKYTLTGEGGKPLDTGKYVVVWKREVGQWKLHRDIWNTSVPASKP
jgi:uncharacterized protein (TIGR02246 family)